MYYWPVAAPNDGLSKALDTIVQSEKCKERFHFSLIDLGSIYKVSGGSISLDKIAGFFRLRTIMRDMVLQGNIDTYYLTIAQSTVGVQTIFVSKDRPATVKDEDLVDITEGLNPFHQQSTDGVTEEHGEPVSRDAKNEKSVSR